MSNSIEDKVTSYRKLAKQIKEMEEKKKLLGAEILAMLEKNTKTAYIAGCRVQRWKRLSIKTSLEDARIFGATKQEEVIDKEALKKLFELGNTVPGVLSLESIVVYDHPSSKDSKEILYCASENLQT